MQFQTNLSQYEVAYNQLEIDKNELVSCGIQCCCNCSFTHKLKGQ